MATFDIYSTLQNDLSVDEENKTISVIPRLASKDYTKLKNLLGRMGGKWVSSKEHFQLKKSPSALIERVLSVGSQCLNKFHFYPTPESIFAEIVKFSDLSFLGMAGRPIEVLEPSCGDGGLINMLLNYGKAEGRDFVVTGYDIDPLNVIVCQEAGLNVMEANFLKVTPEPKFDLILANPPFNGEEFIKHIAHAQKFLNENGMMIVVVPTAWIKGNNKTELRKWLLEQAQAGGDSLLENGDYFRAGTFEGVSIETTFICLHSISRAEKVLASDWYKEKHVVYFDMFFSSSSESFKWISSLSNLTDSARVSSEAKAHVSKILERNDSDTINLPRRFIDDYVDYILTCYIPETFEAISDENDENQSLAAPEFELTAPELPVARCELVTPTVKPNPKPRKCISGALPGQLDLVELIERAA